MALLDLGKHTPL